jgi:hypothetical protein
MKILSDLKKYSERKASRRVQIDLWQICSSEPRKYRRSRWTEFSVYRLKLRERSLGPMDRLETPFEVVQYNSGKVEGPCGRDFYHRSFWKNSTD